MRNLQQLHSGLLKAMKLREDVWDWCKSEGHVGEMSDHEDWVDLEAWGIEGRAFKKGMDEGDGDDVEDVVGRRGVRRRVGRGVKE